MSKDDERLISNVKSVLEKEILNNEDTLTINKLIDKYEKHIRRFDKILKRSDRLSVELEEKNKNLEDLSEQLSKYLSPQIYDMIFSGNHSVKLTSARKKLTIFFSDIVNFTSTTEKLESEELTIMLNDYITKMSNIALKYGATIDKYIGDAIVIFFGDPQTLGYREDAFQCVKMALEMKDKMKEISSKYIDEGIVNSFEIRMGINTGYCTVGNFGSEDRMDYTVIGGNVNLASRLESNADSSKILISHETYSLVKEHIVATKKPAIQVKGISNPVQTYQVDGLKDDTLSIYKKDIQGLSIELNLDRVLNKKDAIQVLHKAIENIVDND